MSFYLHYNNQQTGPYSEDQIRQMLQSGLAPGDALAWKEGMANWTPVREVIAQTGPVVGGGMPAPPKEKRSVLGIISLAVALISLPLWLVLLVLAGMAHNNGTATQGFNIIVGVIFLASIFINFLAMVFGIIGAINTRARTIPIIGACINGFVLVALVGLVILGLAVKQHS